MAGPVFIKDVIKGLKDDEYGTPLRIGAPVASSFSPTTGLQSQQVREFDVLQAIRLPNQMKLEFLQAMGVTKMLDVLTGTIQILLDLDDVPRDFNLKVTDAYAIYQGRKYTVLKSEIYDYAAVLWIKDVGALPEGSTSATALRFSHSVSVTVNA